MLSVEGLTIQQDDFRLRADFEIEPGQTVDGLGQADGRDGDSARADAQPVGAIRLGKGREQGVQVCQGFSHAHDNDMTEPLLSLQEKLKP